MQFLKIFAVIVAIFAAAATVSGSTHSLPYENSTTTKPWGAWTPSDTSNQGSQKPTSTLTPTATPKTGNTSKPVTNVTPTPTATSAPRPGATATPTPTPTPTRTATTPTVVDGAVFLETFSGTPSRPTPFVSPSWTLNVHSRDASTWERIEPMQAHHSATCEGPPTTHTVTSYDDTIFICRDHVMTALNASGYGLLYMTPNAMVDFSRGTASISFDMSTFRASGRDWIDIWVTPWGDNLAVPYNPGEGEVDLQGAPVNAIHIELDRGCNRFHVSAFVNGRDTVNETSFCGFDPEWDNVLEPDASRRDRFELLISQDHIQFWMPDYGLVLAEADISVNFTQGVVQLGHHSYNPAKDCGTANSRMNASTCGPTTWHWDNVRITPAVAFDMNHGDRRMVQRTGDVVTFDEPAAQGSNLRFSGQGTIELSFDGGRTWERAHKQQSVLYSSYHAEHASSYWHPVPAGATSVEFRFSPDGWYEGPYHARDFVIWSR